MAKKTLSIYSFLTELQSFVEIEASILDKAKASDINTGNNGTLKNLLIHWSRGTYDEDPQSLVDSITNLI
jgi:hypothetical protein